MSFYKQTTIREQYTQHVFYALHTLHIQITRFGTKLKHLLNNKEYNKLRKEVQGTKNKEAWKYLQRNNKPILQLRLTSTLRLYSPINISFQRYWNDSVLPKLFYPLFKGKRSDSAEMSKVTKTCYITRQ